MYILVNFLCVCNKRVENTYFIKKKKNYFHILCMMKTLLKIGYIGKILNKTKRRILITFLKYLIQLINMKMCIKKIKQIYACNV